jgi:hypothetical protein
MRQFKNNIVCCVIIAILGVGLVSCSGAGSSSSSQPPQNNPVPAIASLSPSAVMVGAAAQTLTINGTNFLSSSTVTYNGAAHTATSLSSTQLTIGLSVSDQATSGTYPLVVTSPSPGGGASNSVSFTVNKTAVSVTVSPGTANVPAGTTQQFSANVQNTSNTAVTWEVNSAAGGSSTVGTISSSGLYTAPLFPPTGGTVTVSAVSQADSTKSGSATVTTQASTASLAGTFSFDFSGSFAAGGSELAAGSFVADGQGNLTSGVEDINSTSGIFTNVPFTGTYSVGPDGRGSATITSTSGTSNFSFVMISATQAEFIEFDSTTTGSGNFNAQTASAFSNSALSGPYSFGFLGANGSGSPAASAGVFTLDGAGNIVAGTEDVNDAGTITNNLTFTGHYNVASNGRGTATVTDSNGTFNFALYVVSSSQIKFIEIDSSAPIAGNALQQQATSFSNASLSGNAVFFLAGSSTVGPFVGGGLITADGNGKITSGVEDENDAGTVVLNNAVTGTYSIASNGRGTATLNVGGTSGSIVFYMVAADEAEFLGTDASAVSLGISLPQQGSSFSASSVRGHYGFTLAGATTAGPEDTVGQFMADGSGNLTSTDDDNVNGGLYPSVAGSGSYLVASNGRGTATVTTSLGTSTFVLYVQSPTEVLFIEVDDTALGFARKQF